MFIHCDQRTAKSGVKLRADSQHGLSMLARQLPVCAWCCVILFAMFPAALAQSTNTPSIQLAQTPPPSRDVGVERLQQEYAQALQTGNHDALMRALVPLVELTKNTPAWGLWQRRLTWQEFNYGSQSRAIELGEELLAATSVAPEIRSRAASELAWIYYEVNQISQGTRTLAKAQQALAALPATVSTNQRNTLEALFHVARGAEFWRTGDLDESSKTFRQGLLHALRAEEAVALTTKSDPKHPAYRGAVRVTQRIAALLMYALLRQGRTAEGLAIAQEWVTRTNVEQFGPDLVAIWQRRLARALVLQRQFEAALIAARAGYGEQVQLGAEDTSQQALMGRVEEIRSLIGLQQWREADAVLTQFLESTRSDRVAFQRASNAALEAILAAKSGRAEAALKRISGSLRSRTRLYGNNHYLTKESRGIRGVVQLISGSAASALADYEELFTAVLDTPSGWTDLSPTGVRGYYLEIALDEFLNYAAERYRSAGAAGIDANTFARLAQVMDRIGSGSTQQSIIDSTARLRAGTSGLRELLGKEQEIRRALQGIYRDISGVLAEDNKEISEAQRAQVLAKIKELRATANKTQRQLDDARKEISERFPAYRDLVTPVNPRPEAIQSALASGETFLSVLPTRVGTFIVAISSNGQRALHVSPWTSAEIDKRVLTLRKNLDIGALLPTALAGFEAAPFHEIYNEIIKPVAPALKGAHTLIVAAHGSLATIPFSTFLAAPSQDLQSASWLVRDYAISQVPGASPFVSQRRVQSKVKPTHLLIAYADPDFGAQQTSNAGASRNLVIGATAVQATSYTAALGFRYDKIPRLPETRDEVMAIAKALGADPVRDLILGAQATRKSVLTSDLSNRLVVAFATHGLLPGETPGMSKPALAMASPPDPSESPLLDLDDVLTLKLNADWVVLSACNTAGAESGGQAMSGLVRGFLFAGGRSVLATHWAVESDSATALVSAVFSNYAGNSKQSRASNLRQAQLAFVQGKIGAGKYAHPFFWAPYALFGDPAQ
jgi:CHAT domain-containing protein